ncbi:MAG: hypothetical protein A2X94_00515 [Bdellovibrionales bacterium GWB1_55_8]|nr:MAG: hypothetical protein A2X94_00515 [Bdellovibrionales bacterium GWB1_55_8]
MRTTRHTPLSCGIIPVWPVLPSNDKWLYLLLRAYRYWDFPKGMIQPNEDPWTAALRELQEETAITSANPRWGKDFYETPVYSGGKVARYYLAEVPAQSVHILPNPETGQIEHHGFRWMSYEEARALVVPRVRGALDWARQMINRKL